MVSMPQELRESINLRANPVLWCCRKCVTAGHATVITVPLGGGAAVYPPGACIIRWYTGLVCHALAWTLERMPTSRAVVLTAKSPLICVLRL